MNRPYCVTTFPENVVALKLRTLLLPIWRATTVCDSWVILQVNFQLMIVFVVVVVVLFTHNYSCRWRAHLILTNKNRLDHGNFSTNQFIFELKVHMKIYIVCDVLICSCFVILSLENFQFKLIVCVGWSTRASWLLHFRSPFLTATVNLDLRY